MLELANPFGLALLAFAPALILAYRRRKSEKSQTVSSLIILKKLSKKLVPKRRVKLPFRFYIELLGLLVLICAASLPSKKTEKIAVIFDNSLSMSAVEPNKKSRLELAIEKFNSEKDSKSSFQYFTSNPLTKIENLSIKTTATPDKINESVLELAARYDKIWIFTDKISPDKILSAKKASENNERVKVFQIGSSLNNIYFDSARLDQNEEIILKLLSTGDEKKKINLTITGVDFSGKTTSVITNEDLILKSSAELKIKSSKSNLAYKIEITANEFDSIKEDNTAWLIASDELNQKILLVSELATDAGLKKIAGFSYDKVSISEYSKITDFKKYSLIIFHRSAPSSVPSAPCLLILPPENNSLFPINREGALKISSWNKNHTISSYLRTNLLSSSQGVEFDTPLWAEAVISGEKGSIIAAGQYADKLIAASGLELLPFEGRKTPAISILTVNLIKWLSNKGKISPVRLTGERYLAEKNSVIINPNQEIIKTSDSTKNIELDLPGIYLVSKQGGLAVNTFHKNESNTKSEQKLYLSKIQNQKIPTKTNLWKYLTLAAVLFLIFEMFLRREY